MLVRLRKRSQVMAQLSGNVNGVYPLLCHVGCEDMAEQVRPHLTAQDFFPGRPDGPVDVRRVIRSSVPRLE